MGRPDEGRMHRVAVGTAPKAVTEYIKFFSNPKNRLAVVERHDVDWRDGRTEIEERFLWIKARNVSRFRSSPGCPLYLLALSAFGHMMDMD